MIATVVLEQHAIASRERDPEVTPQAPPRELPGAGSPLTRTVLAGPSQQAVVLAGFPTALYLSVGAHHEVLPVLASDALMLPAGFRLSKPGRDLVWGVGRGDSVSIGRTVIRLPGLELRMVREWRPARVRAISTLADRGQLSAMTDLMSCHANTPGLVDQACAVCRAARRGDDIAVRRGVRRLLGAGQGLTPSGDDALCAVLLVLCGVGDPAPVALLGAAVQDRWKATTSLSASLLDAARQGYAVPELVALVDGALRGNLTGDSDALSSTLAIGHWSGPDLVAGLVGSLRAITTARPDTPGAPFQAANGLETVPKRCPDRSNGLRPAEREVS